MLADDAGHGRRRQQSVLADHDLSEAIRRRHAQYGLNRRGIVIAPIPTDDQQLAGIIVEAVENRLDEVLQVTRLLKYRDLFPQTRGSRFLSLPGTGWYVLNSHFSDPLPVEGPDSSKNHGCPSTVAA